MKYEIIGKASGEAMTVQLVIGPYPKEPPPALVKAVHGALTDRFYSWTGSHPATVVVTSQPAAAAGASSGPTG